MWPQLPHQPGMVSLGLLKPDVYYITDCKASGVRMYAHTYVPGLLNIQMCMFPAVAHHINT